MNALIKINLSLYWPFGFTNLFYINVGIFTLIIYERPDQNQFEPLLTIWLYESFLYKCRNFYSNYIWTPWSKSIWAFIDHSKTFQSWNFTLQSMLTLIYIPNFFENFKSPYIDSKPSQKVYNSIFPWITGLKSSASPRASICLWFWAFFTTEGGGYTIFFRSRAEKWQFSLEQQEQNCYFASAAKKKFFFDLHKMIWINCCFWVYIIKKLVIRKLKTLVKKLVIRWIRLDCLIVFVKISFRKIFKNFFL